MLFKEALTKLKQDAVFTAWNQENPDHYLVHGFIMHDKAVHEAWQIGFYNKKEDRIVVFTVEEPIMKNPASELFKKESHVQRLVEKDILFDSDEALVAAEAHRKQEYAKHEPLKTIILLQKLKQGQIWNISFVTKTFSVCNVKIDSKTKKVISSSCENLLGWADKA